MGLRYVSLSLTPEAAYCLCFQLAILGKIRACAEVHAPTREVIVHIQLLKRLICLLNLTFSLFSPDV